MRLLAIFLSTILIGAVVGAAVSAASAHGAPLKSSAATSGRPVPLVATADTLPVKLPAHVSSRYVNPFLGGGWEPSRIDMGMDWVPMHPVAVRAIGAALILGSDSRAPWPGRHIIWYQLLAGSHAGDIVYVAEHLRHLVKAGTVVAPGQRIATALPGYPWTEWGWADTYGSPRALPCYKEGRATNSGKEMARFLGSLGALGADIAGAGSEGPTGKLC